MAEAKVVFFHGLHQRIVEAITSFNPAGFATLDNVVVSPHSAGTTSDTWFRRADFAYKNMRRVGDGQPPQAVATDYDL